MQGRKGDYPIVTNSAVSRKRVLHSFLVTTIIVCVIISSSLSGGHLVRAETNVDGGAAVETEAADLIEMEQFEPYYADVLQQWRDQEAVASDTTVSVNGSDYAGNSESANLHVDSYNGRDQVLIWQNENDNWIEYELVVPESGLYELELQYHAYIEKDETVNNYRPTVLAVTLDGHFPFREARAVRFPRHFRDDLPLRLDEDGNHIRPRPVEIEEWVELSFRDADGAYAEPLQWYFTEGTHTLRLQGYESIVIDKLVLKPPVTTEDYATVLTNYPSGASTTGEIQIVEAEIVHAKNDVAPGMESDQDAAMSPQAKGERIFNSVGGGRWSKENQSITWKFSVPEDGRYKFAMRSLQNTHSNKSIFRKIYIDGEVPFTEMLAYRFPYSSKWEGTVLESEAGVPYEFYLTAGEHTLTLEATYAPFSPIIQEQDEVLQALRLVSQNLNVLTGGAEKDLNRTWNIEEDFPEIPHDLNLIAKQLQSMSETMISINGERDDISQTLWTAATDLESIVKYPNEIPYKIDDLSMVQQKLGSIRELLVQSPLKLDRIYIAPEDESWPRLEATWWEKLMAGLFHFFYSFTMQDSLSDNDDEVLNVWMFFGRDNVNLLQDLADQHFTPQTGIKVKVDLLPREELIVLANATGKAPDVALGLGESQPVNYAIRNAALDLSQFPDFEELSSNFAPGALLPYFYDGGYYGLPETQHFKMLFYRKDILSNLGLSIPNTWQDVYDMLPTLQQNNYNFFIPHNEFLTFIYQNGADFYTQDGMKTALDSPEAFQSFKQLTDLFSIYGIERQVPSFYQHFRDGTMPIGISDFNTYLQLSVAAPELTGWWAMAPMPGVEQPDGTVARWSGGNLGMLANGLGGAGGGAAMSGGGNQTAAMIFEKSTNKTEGWEFIQWWLSTETQERFASDLEGFFGIAFRWNTANIEAFTNLPWRRDELNHILEQWRWYKAMVNIPGSYFIPRELSNAWNRTVLDGMNYRSSLEEAVVNINREIERKSQEFGFMDKDGNYIQTYDPPQITKPWEGVNKYVNE